jgi:mono/diheme cytochrome c family protein
MNSASWSSESGGWLGRRMKSFQHMPALGWLGTGFAVLGALFAAGLSSPPPLASPIANADDRAVVVAGKTIYMRFCASCHGRKLQGQPLWQLDDQFAHRRAPAHDETGHTWQHSDMEIFQMIKFGHFSSAPPNEVSYMPGFKDVLSDPGILDVMAFIKASWPLGLRVSQAMLNPGFTGMPARANEADWTLPPNCTSTSQRWRAEPR